MVNRTILITGANRGLGLMLAITFIKKIILLYYVQKILKISIKK